MRECRVVGNREKRIDAWEKVTGKAVYPADIQMDNMAYGVTVRATKPSALFKLDLSEAEKHPGVLYIFTAKDVPGHNHHGVIFKDHEVFCSERIKSIGAPLALVVAETQEAAKVAAKLVKVTYEELPAVFDPREAMKPDAPIVHKDSNIIYEYKLKKGNVEDAFAKCEVVVENNYYSSMVDHAFLQPEAGVGYIDEEGRIAVRVATQYPHYDREEIADAMGMPQDKIRVLTAQIGGAFGGREDVTVQIHLALAAYKLNRPVKIAYDREESFLAHSKRHPMYMKFKTGALKDGTLYALEAEIIGDSGSYASWAINILRKAGVHATGPYTIENVKVNSYAVYTNNPFTGAMRGFGAAQVAMAYEQQIDEIAKRLGMDPAALRLKNCFRPGSTTATGQYLEEAIPVEETIRKATEKFGPLDQSQKQSGSKKRGRGMATIFYGTGYGNGWPDVSGAISELMPDGRVRVLAGATEVGQGAKTALSQIAAEAMELSLEDIEFINEDTARTPDSGTAAASRQTYNTGNGIRLACEKLRASILEFAAGQLKVNTPMGLRIKDGAVEVKGLPNQKISLRDIYEAAQKNGKILREETAFTAHATRMDDESGQGAPYWPYTFATYVAEVEVDTNTGKVDVIKAVCAQDVGKAVNPTLIEGQIEGGFAMGMSWALYEDLGLENGKIKNNNYSRYILPTSLDMPEIESIIVEDPETTAPYGAKGIGEPVMLAAMPAVLNAIYDATGVRITKLPASPQDILAGLQAAGR